MIYIPLHIHIYIDFICKPISLRRHLMLNCTKWTYTVNNFCPLSFLLSVLGFMF